MLSEASNILHFWIIVMLKWSTITYAVNKVELMVELSALSNLPRKVSFLIRIRQATDGRFRYNFTILREVFICTFRTLLHIVGNCSSIKIVEESNSHVLQPYNNTGITQVSKIFTADSGFRCPWNASIFPKAKTALLIYSYFLDS